MTKHIIGVIVFSLIVGVTAFIASFFVKMPPMPALEPVSENGYYVYSGDRHCKGKKRRPRPKAVDQSASVKVTQAFYDARTKRLDTQFAFERTDENTEKLDVSLQFFVFDEFGVQHIADEFVTLSPNFDIGDVAVEKNNFSFKWLSKLESRANLYVMAKAVNPLDRYEPIAFDPSEATAVLLKPIAVNK